MKDAVDTDNDISRIYKSVEEKELQIFTTICPGKTKIQDCPAEEQEKIFGKVPPKFYLLLVSLVEKEMKCSGLNRALEKYYFTE
jgi:hypothetical protein